jgi:hypothetical protein
LASSNGIEVIPTMVFPDSKDIQADLIGVLDLFDQVPQPIRRVQRTPVLIERGSETVNSNLHQLCFRKRSIDPG